MTKLNDIQIALLTAAGATSAGAIESPSQNRAAVGGLIKRGLFISVPQGDQASQLLITDLGRAAIGLSDTHDPAGATLSDEEAAAPAAEPGSDKPQGKIATLVYLLRRPGGATVDDMMAATGWQAHSVRGALSGAIKKGRGLNVLSEKTEAGRRYRIQTGSVA